MAVKNFRFLCGFNLRVTVEKSESNILPVLAVKDDDLSSDQIPPTEGVACRVVDTGNMPRGGRGGRGGGGGFGGGRASPGRSPSPAPAPRRNYSPPARSPSPPSSKSPGSQGPGMGKMIASSFIGSALGSVLGNAISSKLYEGRNLDTGKWEDPGREDDNPCKKELDYFLDCSKYAGDPVYCKGAAEALKKCVDRHQDYFNEE